MSATLPTVTELADRGAIVLLLAHFGRPKGDGAPDMSLSLVTAPMSGARAPVRFVEIAGQCQGAKSPPWSRATSRSWKTPASIAARKRTIPRLRRDGAAWRCLRQRRLFGRAPRSRLDRGLAHLCPLMPAARWKRS
jgi:phosphoglycerate kinase